MGKNRSKPIQAVNPSSLSYPSAPLAPDYHPFHAPIRDIRSAAGGGHGGRHCQAQCILLITKNVADLKLPARLRPRRLPTNRLDLANDTNIVSPMPRKIRELIADLRRAGSRQSRRAAATASFAILKASPPYFRPPRRRRRQALSGKASRQQIEESRK